jgi:glycosyltransferase involved in cell wall biosynthesis
MALRLAERYNVTVMSIRGGEILDSFLDVSVEVLVGGQYMQRGSSAWRSLKHHFSKKPMDFALVNSVESRQLLPLLDELGVPSICLIHEFASMIAKPEVAFGLVMKSADEVVFSSTRTLDSAAVSASLEFSNRVHVIPQGKCVVPGADRSQVSATAEQESLKAKIRPHGGAAEFVVVGAGYIEPRKGVDLFIEVARQALSSSDGKRLRFFWIGDGLSDGHHPDFVRSIQDQLMRSGIVGNIEFLPKTAEIQYVFELADLLFLASRLDPLPNVAIDAMCTGVPVLCFDAATGLTEILREGALEEACTVEYLNTSEATRKLLMLANTPHLYKDVARRTKKYARAVFDMDTYVRSIEKLALAAKSRRANRAHDVDIISVEASFRPSYVLPFGEKSHSRRQAAQRYISSLSTDIVARRPEPGFNPDAYAQHLCEIAGGQVNVDPYAEFLRQGRPDGFWRLPVIWDSEDKKLSDQARALNVSLHIHAYYVDQLEELLRHFAANSARPDLYISVCNEATEYHAKSLLRNFALDHTVRIVPNRGRDIGPLITEFGHKLVEEYDIIGHVHTKKSLALSDERIVRNWTNFLYENVLGGEKGGAMMDKSLNAFALDEELGIVFPSDPNLIYWSRNRDHPEKLAKRLGLGDLPRNFEFPIGTMFWMRSEVMRPFVNLKLDWTDYPEEPIPTDGTMLHAIERLFGIVPTLKGYRAAVTCVTGLTR